LPRFTRNLLLGILCLLLPGGVTVDGSSSDSPPRFVPGEILVKFRDDVDAGARRQTTGRFNVARIHRDRHGLERMRVGPLEDVETIARKLAAESEVLYAEPNWMVSLYRQPDDPFHFQQYWLTNAGQTGGTPGADIRAMEAWDLTTGSRDVIVAIIDSGIDVNHPDLLPNLWTNENEIAGNGIDDDNNGYVDDTAGWNFFTDNNDPFDDNDHGTHVAGIVGAVGDNGRGVSGVAWKVTLMPLKFTDSAGFGSTSDAVAALDYAVAMGARVSNNSWGGSFNSQALRDAIQRAGEADHLFVAAAGNSAVDIDQLPQFPAGYDLDNILTVMATNDRDLPAFFTNIGPIGVDVAAAGERVLSSVVGGTYRQLTGTSMAAPQVTGVAALALSVAPNIPALALKQRILDSAIPVPSLTGYSRTGARLDALGVLQAIDDVAPGRIDDLHLLELGSTRAVITWTAPGDDGDDGTVWRYRIRVAAEGLLASGPIPLAAGATQTFELNGLTPDADLSMTVQGQDEWGNVGPVSNVLTVHTLPPPIIDVSPSAFELFLDPVEVGTAQLRIANAGPGELDWMITGLDSRPLDERVTFGQTVGRLIGGQSIDVPLTIDTNGLAAGFYGALVNVRSNDVSRPELDIPLAVIIGLRPRLVVGRSGPTEESEQLFDDSPAGTTHRIELGSQAIGPMTVTVSVEGDFAESSEFGTVSVDGEFLGIVQGGGTDCSFGGRSFILSGQDVERLAGDGVLIITIENSADVATFCSNNVHGLQLAYREPVSSLEFPETIVGLTEQMEVDLINVGSSALRIASISSELLTDYTAVFPFATLQTDQVLTLEVLFHPQTPGRRADTLSITTNEPDHDATQLFLEGVGLAPPILRLQPDRIERTLDAGERIEASFEIGNDGASPLVVTLESAGSDLVVAPQSGLIPAGETEPFTLEIDGTDFVAGLRETAIMVRSNDPDALQIALPIILEIRGEPRIRLEPAVVRIDSEISYSTLDAVTTHIFPISIPIVGAARFEMVVDGDFGLIDESATLTVEGDELLSISDAERDCEPIGIVEPLSIDDVTRWNSDNQIEAIVSNSPKVDLFCERNSHRLSLIYDGPSDRLEFGDGFVEFESIRNVVITNSGTDRLTFDSVETSGSAYELGVVPQFVEAGASRSIPVRFTPDALGDHEGELVVISDATNAAVVRLPLHGHGVPAPSLRVTPLSLTFNTTLGEIQSRSLSMENNGSVPVGFSASAVGTVISQVSITPVAGTVAPGDVAEITITVDGTDLPAGAQDFAVMLATEDPQQSLIEIPVNWVVTGTPRLGFSTSRYEQRSRVEFSVAAAATEHQFSVDRPAAGNVDVSLHVVGDFGSIGEQAALLVEGQFLLSAGGNSADCVPITETTSVSPARLSQWSSNGTVDVIVQNSAPVGTICPERFHEVTLRYPELASSVEVGQVFLGRPDGTQVEIFSNGNSDLNIQSLTTTGSSFRVVDRSFVLEPGESEMIEITVLADDVGVLSGELIVASNATDQPLTRLPLRATSNAAPQAVLSPSLLQHVVLPATPETFELSLSNAGGLPLSFSTAPEVAVGVELETLPASPGPAACLVADPIGGQIYTQIRRANEFYRFDVTSSTWTTLSRSPMAAEEFCRSVLLDGKIHVFHSNDRDFYAVYDIAVDRWERRPHPVDQNVGAVAGDGESFIYLARLARLFRHDPETEVTTELAPPPFPFERGGGLEFFDGHLYGHRGNGNPDFARYDIAVDRWDLQQQAPSGLRSGTTFDPILSSYYVIAEPDAGIVYRHDTRTNRWQAIDVAPLVSRKGELAWIGRTNPGVYFQQGEFGREFIRLGTPEGIVQPPYPSGVVAPGESVVLPLMLRTDLPIGPYRETIHLRSNDPETPVTSTILDVTIAAAGRLEMGPVGLDLTTFVGVPRTELLEFSNRGDRPIRVVDLEIADPRARESLVIDGMGSPVELAPREHATRQVTWTPTSAGDLATSLVAFVENSDPSTMSVVLTGTSRHPPKLLVDPERIAVALPPRPHLKTLREIHIANVGDDGGVRGMGTELQWTLSQTTIPAPAGRHSRDVGRQDAFGYRWRTEDEPGGPLFDWQEISGRGVSLDLASDDQVSEPIPIGFPFEFYGRAASHVHVSTDGWLSFADSPPSYSNPPALPDTGVRTPADLIAPFWDDLNLTHRGQIFVESQPHRFIVQYEAVERFSSPGALTFQVLLYRDGRIVFQYRVLEGATDSATIGIQNSDRTIGNLVVANQSFVQDRRAIEFRRAPDWLHISPASGAVSPAGEDVVTLTVDTGALPSGSFAADLELRSNDPFQSQRSIPLIFHIGEIKPLEILVPLGRRRHGDVVEVFVELPSGLDPRTIVASGVRLQGTLAPIDETPIATDRDGDGVPEGRIRFDADRFLDLVRQDADGSLELTGEVRDTTWFRGTFRLRWLDVGSPTRSNRRR